MGTLAVAGEYRYFSGYDGKLVAGLYRCKKHDCDATRERLPNVRGSVFSLQAFGDRLGVANLEDGEHWLGSYALPGASDRQPDATLSEAPADTTTVDASTSDGVVSIAVGDGWLYAAVTHSETGKSCDSSCPYRMERWPVGGGEQEILFDTDGMIRRVFVLDGELAWLDRSLRDPENLDAAVLSTCRVEACEATRRGLGEVRPDLKALVGDEVDWYWLEAEPAVSQGLPNYAVLDRQIRRAPRLTPR